MTYCVPDGSGPPLLVSVKVAVPLLHVPLPLMDGGCVGVKLGVGVLDGVEVGVLVLTGVLLGDGVGVLVAKQVPTATDVFVSTNTNVTVPLPLGVTVIFVESPAASLTEPDLSVLPPSV